MLPRTHTVRRCAHHTYGVHTQTTMPPALHRSALTLLAAAHPHTPVRSCAPARHTTTRAPSSPRQEVCARTGSMASHVPRPHHRHMQCRASQLHPTGYATHTLVVRACMSQRTRRARARAFARVRARPLRRRTAMRPLMSLHTCMRAYAHRVTHMCARTHTPPPAHPRAHARAHTHTLKHT